MVDGPIVMELSPRVIGAWQVDGYIGKPLGKLYPSGVIARGCQWWACRPFHFRLGGTIARGVRALTNPTCLSIDSDAIVRASKWV